MKKCKQHPEPECESYPPYRTENPSRIAIVILLAGLLITLLTAKATEPTKKVILLYPIGATVPDTIKIETLTTPQASDTTASIK